MAIVSFKGWAI